MCLSCGHDQHIRADGACIACGCPKKIESWDDVRTPDPVVVSKPGDTVTFHSLPVDSDKKVKP